MKWFSTLAIVFGISLQSFGQGYLSTPLGSDSNSVKKFLTKRGARIGYDGDGNLLGTHGDLKATYLFASGKLYEIQTEKLFRNKKLTEETYQEFLSFFDGVKTAWSESVSESETTLYAVFNNELNVITKYDCAGKNPTVKLRQIGLAYQPGTVEATASPKQDMTLAMAK